MKIFILFIFIFSFISSAQSSQKNILNNLFSQLQKINNPKSAALLEKKIWSVWNEHPDDFKLTGKWNQKAERCGRMVPPLMMQKIAESVYEKVLEKYNG